MHEFLVSVASFIVLVGVMVVVHEFGHFAIAKLFGVRVESFSVGFGPRLFGVTFGETEYKVCLLPLGGFVRMTGEAPEQNLEAPGKQPEVLADDPGALTSHPRWQRMLIGLAGPTANFILAFVLMFFYFAAINEVPSVEVTATTIEWVIPGSQAAQAGLQPGDVIRRFDNQDNPSWEVVAERANINLNQTVPVSVLRGGNPVALSLHIPSELKGDDLAGMLPQFLLGPIGVEQVQSGTPADQAGLRAGDAIQSVDGHAFHTVTTLLAYMQSGEGKPVSLQVLRNGSTLSMTAQPAKLDGAGYKLGFINRPPPYRDDPLPLNKAAAKSTAFCADNSTLIVEVLRRLFTRQVSATQLSGPVGIARMAGEAAEMKGWSPKFILASEISLNLGILNLLPFPILDGGMIFLLLIESLLRHDISINVKERIYQAAFVVIIAFFAFIIFNDVTKLPIFTHVKP
ncbi:MAG: RIP metalloprotease RseP [Terracidiphilus sp.]|jgi:regulator of sigma E protease